MSNNKHTGGTWSVGKTGGAVVSTDVIPGLPDYRTGHSDVDYYGGYLIAESIWNPADARVMAAAPDLFDACKQMVAAASINDDCELGNAVTAARLAIAKATGEQS